MFFCCFSFMGVLLYFLFGGGVVVFCLFVGILLFGLGFFQSITALVLSIFPTGIGSLAASYLNPVKSFVPQMPKLLKSLFPVRDEKKGRQTSPLAQQVTN